MPLWKHVYHMLHSLDLWFMNPNDTGYKEPGFHVKDLNNLDVVTEKEISREQIHDYFFWVEIPYAEKRLGEYGLERNRNFIPTICTPHFALYLHPIRETQTAASSLIGAKVPHLFEQSQIAINCDARLAERDFQTHAKIPQDSTPANPQTCRTS